MRAGILIVLAACGGAGAPAATQPAAEPQADCHLAHPDGTDELRLEARFSVYLPCGERGQSNARMWFSRAPNGTLTGAMGGCAGAALNVTAATLDDHTATLAATDASGVPWAVTMTALSRCVWSGQVTVGDHAPSQFMAQEPVEPHLL